ncbi:Piso0_005330 [Millerozyma farinosa CBS 7064]|uniref:Piso0_005330 protein n=1 Tax=Pichia sorbitophila (strain ATCC MYA-4447 / BCRC 22081 / CBS 7064 / NBRC 10061 / NRRL Y-12695) TaxID=559304 RepID=G8Y1W4_PICSO|nr:Piso0_005330 [Millerozyma farinosa CBS 7064]
MGKKELSYECVVNFLWQRVPPRDFLNDDYDCGPILTYDSQIGIADEIEEIKKHNPYYAKLFLQKYIKLVEQRNSEMAEVLYFLYCNGDVLSSSEEPSSKPDVIRYLVRGANKPTTREQDTVVIEETPRVISALGTTGMRTWEAALYLSAYLNSRNISLEQQRVCELGAGTGLVGLALAKYYHRRIAPVREIIFTDISIDLLEKIQKTLALNNLSMTDPSIAIRQLAWGSTNVSDRHFEQHPPDVDYLVAADVIYDSDMHAKLCSTIKDFLSNSTKLAIVAATIRNEKTADSWHAELRRWFHTNWSIKHRSTDPSLSHLNCYLKASTPEIRIYYIALDSGLL